LFEKTVFGDENIWKWMKHVNFIKIFFFAVDVTTLGSMHKSWSSSMCNAAHGPSYLDADICPRILFLRHMPYVWPSHGSLVCDK